MRFAKTLASHRDEIRKFGRRFWLRNLANRTKDGLRPIRVDDVGPIYIRPGESDLEILWQVWIGRFFELQPKDVFDRVQRRYEELLLSGKVPIIIDAGANIGVSTVWFAHHYPKARIVAIEPDAASLALLRKNVAQRDCLVLEAAIGATPGFASLSNSGDMLSWTVQTTRSPAGVPIITVDEAAERSGGDQLFIVKIDIEGFEADLFESNLGWLDELTALFVEPHDWMFPGKRVTGPLQQALANRSFELFIGGNTLAYVRV